MNDKFQGKYRITSARAQWWDYSAVGAYFITICTAGRFPYFGYIENGVMNYSEIGIIAGDYWHRITNHAKDVKLGAFVIMPNHIHGIIEIVQNEHVSNVETRHALSLQQDPLKQPGPPESHGKSRFRNPGKNTISSIIGGYKSAVSREYRRDKVCLVSTIWQSRFYDHIIRDEAEHSRIMQYIDTNPINWKTDRFNNG